jgi:uncharacterized damage-inducible protein DinB
MLDLSLNNLLDYTDWERQQWHDWLRRQGDHVLQISAGQHGDGRFQVVGELVRHIFSAEKRYVDRLSGRSLTDTAAIPSDSIDALFQFGEQSRKQFKEFIKAFPAQQWDVAQDFKMLGSSLTATPRKIITHVVVHEIRHWAQIATLLRLNGMSGDFHDFLFSPVLGGEFRRGESV